MSKNKTKATKLMELQEKAEEKKDQLFMEEYRTISKKHMRDLMPILASNNQAITARVQIVRLKPEKPTLES